MINIPYTPRKIGRNYSDSIYDLGYGFYFERSFEFRPMCSRPSWPFYFEDILLEGVEEDFISALAGTLEGFVRGLMGTQKYSVSDYLIFEEATVDDRPAILCTIHYIDEDTDNKEKTKEIFFDKFEANRIVKSLEDALTRMHPMILHSM
ncbi:MAG TPA: hypothetical protein ENO02_01095 [Epsilonproteobacteria bacterium]|nr:hypothetical protein [Campylobacterota bacterium]